LVARIFGIGLNKTGTISLNAALRHLGIDSVHNTSLCRKIQEEIKSGEFPQSATTHEAILDFPSPTDCYRELAEHFPESKLILTTRDKEEWIRSRIIHVLHNRIVEHNNWKDIDTRSWEAAWDDHHREVVQWGQNNPGRLLVMNLEAGDGWKTLCEFLEQPVPQLPFPHHHRGADKLREIAQHYGCRYEFTSDWFSCRVHTWEKFLGPLKGTQIHTLEIGVFEGRSALWTLENVLTHPDSTITCIDPWSDVKAERRFDRNILASGRSNQVVKLKGPSAVRSRHLPLGRYSFVYIDGSHEGLNVLEDAVHSFRLLKSGGILCFDDYWWESDTIHHRPREAIDSFLCLYDGKVEILERGYQVFLRKL